MRRGALLVACTLVATALAAPPGARATAPGDGLVEDRALGHDSGDPLYRNPPGAVPVGTEVSLRVRARADDVTAVHLHLVDAGSRTARDVPMARAASRVTCFDAALDAGGTCDYWEAAITPEDASTVLYRFDVTDGPRTLHYADNGMGEHAGDGGFGTATWVLVEPDTFQFPCCISPYAITVYEAGFEPIPWLRDAVVYQIFPERFRNGDPSNDPTGDEPRYGYPELGEGDRIRTRSWDELPEGACRSWEGGCGETPLGRDYFGGDLLGIEQGLDHLDALGVTALYLNPIFDGGTNHAYDTQDLTKIDPFFGSAEDWDSLVDAAAARGIRIILDGQFHSMSSDSPIFDRYDHADGDGACESPSSPYRSWFLFRTGLFGWCYDDLGLLTQTYDSWSGIDVLPTLNKNDAVRDLIYRAEDSVARRWLRTGAAGWRLDSMSSSFPADFWPEFRAVVKEETPDAPIIGELWHRVWVMPWIHGTTIDGVMNYRFRNAVEAFLGGGESEGFATGGVRSPSAFASKIELMREDYPDAIWFGSLNLLGSHDTNRILWNLTPGRNTREDRELDPEQLAVGKRRLRLATLLQMTMPGAPTIYYGDEIGLTGADDPDNRRTFPWAEDGTAGGDPELLGFTSLLKRARHETRAIRDGDIRFLLADDEARTLAYARAAADGLALTAVNSDDEGEHELVVQLGGTRDGISFTDVLSGRRVASEGGAIRLSLGPLEGALLVADAGQDLTGPTGVVASAVRDGADVRISWDGPADAASFLVERSPLSGGGYAEVGATSARELTDERAPAGSHYVVRALDAAGNAGPPSADVAA